MNFDINNKLIHEKIDEYLSWLSKTGLVTDPNLLNEISKRLHSLKIIRIYDAPGDARVDYENLYYCSENIISGMVKNGPYFLDEVLFHEFSHLINSFHNSIRGPKSFMIRDAIESKMDNFTNAELLEQEDKLIYNQDPCFGVILLDEYVAQSIAQLIIEKKYNSLDEKNKRKYAFDSLSKYKRRDYTTKLSEPPYQLVTSLADYPEYDLPAQNFINKYLHTSSNDFIKRSLNSDLLRNIITSLDYEEAEEIYFDLCYLGLIENALSIYRGFRKESNPNDPVHNPKNIYKAFKKVLKKDN